MKQIIEKIVSAPAWFRRSASATYILVVTILSLLPASTLEDIPSWLDNADKLIHALMYGGMATMICWTINRGHANPTLYYASVFIFCAGYGLLMEVLQATFSQLERSFSWGDVLANMAGTVIFIPLKERIMPSRLDSPE